MWMISRLAPSLFRGLSARGLSALGKIITSAGALVVYAPAEVIIFPSADKPRDRLGASLDDIISVYLLIAFVYLGKLVDFSKMLGISWIRGLFF